MITVYSYLILPIVAKLPPTKAGIVFSILLAIPSFLPDLSPFIDEIAVVGLIISKISKYKEINNSYNGNYNGLTDEQLITNFTKDNENENNLTWEINSYNNMNDKESYNIRNNRRKGF